MTKEELAKQIALIQDCKKTKFTDTEIEYLEKELSKVPEHIVLAAFSQFLHSDDFYTTSRLFARITEIAEMDPNYNPERQWAIVYDQYEQRNLGCLKIVFDNVRTNLAIEFMGGQEELVRRLKEGGKYVYEKIRDEFIECFRKAVIQNTTDWQKWNLSFAECYMNNPERKGKVLFVGVSKKEWIPENDVCGLLSSNSKTLNLEMK